MRKQSQLPDLVVQDGKLAAVILEIEHYENLLTRLDDKNGLAYLRKAVELANEQSYSE